MIVTVTVTVLSLVQVWFSELPVITLSSAGCYYFVSFQILIVITLSRPVCSRIQTRSRSRFRDLTDLYQEMLAHSLLFAP